MTTIEYVDLCGAVRDAANELRIESPTGTLAATEQYSVSWAPEMTVYDDTDEAATFVRSESGDETLDCRIWLYSGEQSDRFPRFEVRLLLAPDRKPQIPDAESDGAEYATEHTFKYGDYVGTQDDYSIQASLGNGLFLEIEEDETGGNWGYAPDSLANRRDFQEPILKKLIEAYDDERLPLIEGAARSDEGAAIATEVDLCTLVDLDLVTSVLSAPSVDDLSLEFDPLSSSSNFAARCAYEGSSSMSPDVEVIIEDYGSESAAADFMSIATESSTYANCGKFEDAVAFDCDGTLPDIAASGGSWVVTINTYRMNDQEFAAVKSSAFALAVSVRDRLVAENVDSSHLG